MNEPGSAASELDARYWGWVRFVWNARFYRSADCISTFRNSDPADEIIAAKICPLNFVRRVALSDRRLEGALQ
jgi:hypothetical protein